MSDAEEEDVAPPQLRTTRVRPQLTPRPSTPPPPKRSSALPPATGLGKGDGGPPVDPEALATWCRRNEVDESEGGVRCFNCRGNEILDPVRQALERRGWVENADPNSGAAGKEEREREREKERDGGREKETRRGGATPRHDLHDLHDLRSTRKQRQ